jgi:dephospho-CoA kinase
MRPSFVFGVLGGVASGKSAVARELAGPAGVVLDADREVHEVLRRPEVLDALRAEHGAGIVGPDGALDRAALARIVFADREARRRLEALTHPLVRANLRSRLEAARASGVPRIVLDVPLLLENDAQHGLVAECDALVWIEAEPATRAARAAATRGWSPDEVARREAAQWPHDAKRARARHVVENDGTLDDMRRAVARVLRAEGLS